MDQQEHHLQRAIVAGLIIPTPEVSELPNREYYDKVYPANYKQPRQLIHMQRKLIFSGAKLISNPLKTTKQKQENLTLMSKQTQKYQSTAHTALI